MRLIDVKAGEVRAVAVSPDGRFVAASGAEGWYAVYDWSDGTEVRRLPLGETCDQFAFGPGNWVAYAHRGALRLDRLDAAYLPAQPRGEFAGGVAVSPDGKTLLATQAGTRDQAKLQRWALPGLQPVSGYDSWSPFRRLAFSPDGQYLAGIWPFGFELRFAASAGVDFRHPPLESRLGDDRPFGSVGFVSFTHDSGTCAFGWDGEFHVLDISTGTYRYLRRVEARFRDAAFTGSGRHFATVDDAGRLKLWDPRAWQVVREYDWGCGPLTCLAFTADGLAGVCGTADGRLVQFDVDE